MWFIQKNQSNGTNKIMNHKKRPNSNQQTTLGCFVYLKHVMKKFPTLSLLIGTTVSFQRFFFSHVKRKRDRQLRITHTINTTGLNKRADSFRVFCPFFVTIRDCGRKNSSEAYQCTHCQEGKRSPVMLKRRPCRLQTVQTMQTECYFFTCTLIFY